MRRIFPRLDNILVMELRLEPRSLDECPHKVGGHPHSTNIFSKFGGPLFQIPIFTLENILTLEDILKC